MKLYHLYTEDSTQKEKKELSDFLSNAAKGKKRTPNPKHSRVVKMIKKVHEEIWGEYHQASPTIKRKIDSCVNSIERENMSELTKIDNEKSLKDKIGAMFRAAIRKVSSTSK